MTRLEVDVSPALPTKLLLVKRLAWRIANQFNRVARWIGHVDAFGAIAVRINWFSSPLSSLLKRGFIDPERDVRRVLCRRDQGQFALADAQKGPRFVLVKHLSAEVFDVKLDALRDVARFDCDMIHFKHGFQ